MFKNIDPDEYFKKSEIVKKDYYIIVDKLSEMMKNKEISGDVAHLIDTLTNIVKQLLLAALVDASEEDRSEYMGRVASMIAFTRETGY